jgi:adenine phosphoribosyltransferase
VTVKSLIRTIPDFPKPGIRFRDITPLLGNRAGFREVIQQMAERFTDGNSVDKVAAIEARGFIFGSAIAHALHVGFVPIRKAGKLPSQRIGHDYDLEYGTSRIEMHSDAVVRGERVLVVDDLLATGGTASAALSLLETLGAAVVGCAFVVDLPELGGRAQLERRGYQVFSVCSYTNDEA